jgi:hypothetical protein
VPPEVALQRLASLQESISRLHGEVEAILDLAIASGFQPQKSVICSRDPLQHDTFRALVGGEVGWKLLEVSVLERKYFQHWWIRWRFGDKSCDAVHRHLDLGGDFDVPNVERDVRNPREGQLFQHAGGQG